MKTNSKPPCPVCGQIVIGRKDKDFCSVACKSKHHEIGKKQSLNIQILDCNKFIKRNYIVLLGIFRGKINHLVLHKNVLFENGFNVYEYLEPVSRNGKSYCKILEFEFRILDDGNVEIYCVEEMNEFYSEFIDRWKIPFPDDFHLKMKKYMDGIFRFFKIIKKIPSKKPTVKSFTNGERINILPLPT